MKIQLIKRQLETKAKIEKIASAMGIDLLWAVSIAMTESSLGLKQSSPFGCVEVFQMSTIAMRDLLDSMHYGEDDTVDIACGLAFMYLLLKRHGSVEKATEKYCDPKDRETYSERVRSYMKVFSEP